MTDFVPTAPLAIRHLRLPRIRFPKFGIGTKINVLSMGIGRAFCMAYVEPYKTSRNQPAIFSDVDLEGRDPNW